jgi:CubicO group peptidase (beta-lactamase class C family)
VTVAFERTTAVVQQEIDEQLFTRGAQISIRQNGETVFDVALGTSGLPGPLTADTIFRVYCTIKPILAVAVAAQVAQGALDLDEPLADTIERPTRLPLDVTPRTVLTHTAGLHRVMGLTMEFLTPEQRVEVVASTIPPSGWKVGRDAGYSEYAGWHLLGWLLEDISGEPLREHLRRVVLDPLSLTNTWIGMTDDEYQQVLPRLGMNHQFRDLKMYPIVAERSQRLACETNPAHGGYTNARDIATFYECLLERLSGGGSDALPPAAVLSEFCSTARPSTYDAVLGRECPFGLGFMTSLAHHFFSTDCSRSSFGHSGNVGSSFGLADPAFDLAVGVVYNGLVTHDVAFLRRRVLLHAIYEDLGIAEEQIRDAETSATPPRRRRFLGRERA